MANIYSKEVRKMTKLNILDTLMAHVYEKRKDNDGFLYITYTDETTLGQ